MWRAKHRVDLLAAQGVSATYYFSDVSFLALWGDKYIPISRPRAQPGNEWAGLVAVAQGWPL